MIDKISAILLKIERTEVSDHDDGSIQIPDDLMAFIEAQVKEKIYESSGDYLISSIRAAERRLARTELEDKLIEGPDSPVQEMTSEEWRALEEGSFQPKSEVPSGMSVRYVVRAIAKVDLKTASDFIRRDSEVAARKRIREAKATFKRLSRFPDLGTEFQTSRLSCSLRYISDSSRFWNYIISYRPVPRA